MRELATDMLIRWSFVLACSAGAASAQLPLHDEPDLAAVELPILDEARGRPEVLWSFLLDPGTPYEHALAAASRCADLLPLRFAEPLLRARAALRREQLLHGLGLEPPKYWSGVPGSPEAFDRERRLLGRTWTVPDPRPPYPTTWAEACAAPWPWRTAQVLDRAFGAMVQRIGTPGAPGSAPMREWQQRSRAWYAECLRWRIDDEESAGIFFEATKVPAHGKSLAVLARWRRILLDPRTPLTALLVARAVGEAHEMLVHGEPEARLACHVLAVDGLRSPHEEVRRACAWQLRTFRSVFDARMVQGRAPCPPEALLAVGDLAAAAPPADGSGRWAQLYVHAFAVCVAVDDPPFAANPLVAPDQPEVARLLAKFSTWWATRRAVVAAQVAARAENVERVREQLEAMAR